MAHVHSSNSINSIPGPWSDGGVTIWDEPRPLRQRNIWVHSIIISSLPLTGFFCFPAACGWGLFLSFPASSWSSLSQCYQSSLWRLEESSSHINHAHSQQRALSNSNVQMRCQLWWMFIFDWKCCFLVYGNADILTLSFNCNYLASLWVNCTSLICQW